MKKTEYITYRTSEKVRKILKKLADERKWSLSQISEEIVKEWLDGKLSGTDAGKSGIMSVF